MSGATDDSKDRRISMFGCYLRDSAGAAFAVCFSGRDAH
jgi:hypothetical protein